MARKGFLVFAAILLLAITAAEGHAREKSLTVGVSALYSGAMSVTGKSVSNGALDYMKWVVKRGGIEYRDPGTGQKERVKLKIIWEDNGYDIARSITVYKRLRARKANVIMGIGSSPGEACAATASRDKLPYLCIYGTASPAGYKPRPQYYLALEPTIGEISTPPIKWFLKEKWQEARPPRIGILCTDIPSWRMIGEKGYMDAYVKGLGGELAGIEFIPVLVTDLSVPLTRLVHEKKADCLLHVGVLAQTVVLAKDLRRLGIDTKKTTVMCIQPAWDEGLFKSIPEEMQGMYGQAIVVSQDEDVPGMRRVKELAKWAGRHPEDITFNYSNGYVGALVLETVLKKALEKSGYDKVSKSGELIRDAFNLCKEVDTGGLSHGLGVTHPDYPYLTNYALMYEAKGDKFVKSGGWVSVDLIEGSLGK